MSHGRKHVCVKEANMKGRDPLGLPDPAWTDPNRFKVVGAGTGRPGSGVARNAARINSGQLIAPVMSYL